MPRIPEAIKRRRAAFSIVVIVLLLVLVFGGGTYLGMFSGTHLEQTTSQTQWVLGIEHQGRYGRAPRIVDEELRPLLVERGLADGTGETAALIQDYPWQKNILRNDRRSIVGVLVTDDNQDVADPLIIMRAPGQTILLASTEAHPSVASYRLFPKIERWLAANNYETAGPALEIYRDNGMVEIQVPIRPAKP